METIQVTKKIDERLPARMLRRQDTSSQVLSAKTTLADLIDRWLRD